jgi:hypothetical protein
VEPVDGFEKGQQPVQRDVPSADVGTLMEQDVPELGFVEALDEPDREEEFWADESVEGGGDKPRKLDGGEGAGDANEATGVVDGSQEGRITGSGA